MFLKFGPLIFEVPFDLLRWYKQLDDDYRGYQTYGIEYAAKSQRKMGFH